MKTIKRLLRRLGALALACAAAGMMLAGCSHLAPQGHDKVTAAVSQRWTMPNGDIRDTSASLTLDRWEYIGDKATTVSLAITPTGEVKVDGGQTTGKQSAVSAWGALMGFLSGLFVAGGI